MFAENSYASIPYASQNEAQAGATDGVVRRTRIARLPYDPTEYPTGRTHRTTTQGPDEHIEPFRVHLTRHKVVRDFTFGTERLEGRATRGAFVGPYPDIRPYQRIYVRNTLIEDLLNGKVRRKAIYDPDPEVETVQRRAQCAQSYPPLEVLEGRIFRTRWLIPDPDAVIQRRPFKRQAIDSWITEEALEGRITRRTPKEDPIDIALPMRTILTSPLPPQPGRIRRGKNFFTGESYDPHDCPSRPPQPDEVPCPATKVEESESIPARVDCSEVPPPVFTDECK